MSASSSIVAAALGISTGIASDYKVASWTRSGSPTRSVARHARTATRFYDGVLSIRRANGQEAVLKFTVGTLGELGVS
ncbi:MAG: hypothetical protein U0527_01095 [Candidatus Eisenbacteria bacterium]